MFAIGSEGNFKKKLSLSIFFKINKFLFLYCLPLIPENQNLIIQINKGRRFTTVFITSYRKLYKKLCTER